MIGIDLQQLQRLEPTDAYLHEAHGVEIVPVGPFRAMLDRTAQSPWGNTAFPVDDLPAEDDAGIIADLRAIRALFAQYHAPLTVEFNEPLWPRLPQLMEHAGFSLEEQEPLLLCTPTTFRPAGSADVSVRFLQPDDADADLTHYRTIFSSVLAHDGWRPTTEALAVFRAEVTAMQGRSHALASLHGTAVGTGFISSFAGVAEITRVATVPSARRRGVAATAITFMACDRFDAGDTLCWLTASGDAAQALYHTLGFRDAGSRLYYRPSAAAS